MMNAFLSPVSFLRSRMSTLLHRNNRLKAAAAERRERWNQVIAEHKNPALDRHREDGGEA